MSATLDPAPQPAQMPTGTLLTRTTQEPIHALAQFSALVSHAIRSAPDAQKARHDYQAALHAECLACGIRLNGEELLLLSEDSKDREPRLTRLRLGYCARRTCDSRFYQLTCNPAPGVDWAPIFAIKDGFASAPEELHDEALIEVRPRTRIWLTAAAAGLTILLLALSWQLYAGGSIPFIRQAEKFQVDPMPPLEQLVRNP